jgi:hypothetical protein
MNDLAPTGLGLVLCLNPGLCPGLLMLAFQANPVLLIKAFQANPGLLIKLFQSYPQTIIKLFQAKKRLIPTLFYNRTKENMIPPSENPK